MIILKANNISYSVPELKILNSISFEVEKGKVIGIAGESGSGKTTLSKIIAGILKPTSGKLKFSPTGIWNISGTKPVQILFQNSDELINPFREVEEMISEIIHFRNKDLKKVKEETERLLNEVNFPSHLWRRKGFELSGGERQRAALARLLAAKPELLILDEPFSAQDPESQLNLLKLFKKINKEFKITLICVAHNLRILKNLCDEILIMYKGEIVESGIIDDIFTRPVNDYTKFLLKAENYDLTYEEYQKELKFFVK